MTFRFRPAIWLVSFAALCMPLAVLAESSVVFERADITIASPPPNEKEKAPKTIHPLLKYSVESRSEDALKLEYIHTLNTLTPDSGVLIYFDAPSVAALPPFKVYTPVDALFVADDGTIVQILPNVVLGEMTQEIKAHMPVKAFLFLQAGTAAASAIRPHDVISGKMFAVAPPVQD